MMAFEKTEEFMTDMLLWLFRSPSYKFDYNDVSFFKSHFLELSRYDTG